MVFSSPNASSLPTIPHQPGIYFFNSEESGNPRFARSVQWSLNEYPYLAYSLVRVQFRGLILVCLSHHAKKKMPFVRDGKLWRLNSECATSWKCLEAHTSVNLSLIKRISQCAQSAQYIGSAHGRPRYYLGPFQKDKL